MIFIALWSIGLLILFLLFYWGKGIDIRPFKLAGTSLIIFALVVRLIPNFLTPAGSNYDIQSYQIVAELARNGTEIYKETAGENRYPYLPFWLYWLKTTLTISQLTGLPFQAIVRLLPIFADVILGWLIFHHISKERSFQEGYKTGLLYAVNPISVFVVAYQGQFDSVALLFLVASGLTTLSHPLKSGLFLGFGVLIKSWPILGFPSLVFSHINWKSRIIFTTGVLIIPLLGVLAYSTDFGEDPVVVFQRAISYNRGIGIWGYSYLIRLLCHLFDLNKIYYIFTHLASYITLLALILIWWFNARHKKNLESILLVFLAFFCTTHAFAIQYLIWLVPLGLINGDYKWSMRYVVVAFFYMFLVYFTLILQTTIDRLLPLPLADLYIIIPASLPIWFITIGWFISHLRRWNQ